MTEHPNVELTRRGYDAFAKGDLAALSELLADDVTWHVRGVGPLSGDHLGRDEVFAFFGRLAEETAGTFRFDVHDVLANDEHSVALCTLSASRARYPWLVAALSCDPWGLVQQRSLSPSHGSARRTDPARPGDGDRVCPLPRVPAAALGLAPRSCRGQRR